MCLDKKKSGLAIKNHLLLNKACLCISSWRFDMCGDNFWRQVILGKFSEEEIWWCSVRGRKYMDLGYEKQLGKDG